MAKCPQYAPFSVCGGNGEGIYEPFFHALGPGGRNVSQQEYAVCAECYAEQFWNKYGPQGLRVDDFDQEYADRCKVVGVEPRH